MKVKVEVERCQGQPTDPAAWQISHGNALPQHGNL